MNDEIKRALATVARYQGASEVVQYYRVGDGPYALVSVFTGGKRMLKAAGFASVEDAELFAAYAEHAGPAARQRVVEQLEAQGAPPMPPMTWERYEIVKLEPAVASGDLAKLGKLFGGEQ